MPPSSPGICQKCLLAAVRSQGRARRIDSTTGWRPTCDHEGEPVPAVVCDPFAGAGTVGLVARKAGRRAVLIELNPDYCAMARERLRQGVLI